MEFNVIYKAARLNKKAQSIELSFLLIKFNITQNYFNALIQLDTF